MLAAAISSPKPQDSVSGWQKRGKWRGRSNKTKGMARYLCTTTHSVQTSTKVGLRTSYLMPWAQCYRKNGSHRGKCSPFLSALPCPQETGDGGEREAFRTEGAGTPENGCTQQLPFSLAFLLTHFPCSGCGKETDLEHKRRVTQHWHRATGHLKSGRILSADLRLLWIRYLRLLCTDSLWQGSGTVISLLFDEMTLCDYCTLKLFLHPLFLSLGFFSGDIFVVYWIRSKKNK